MAKISIHQGDRKDIRIKLKNKGQPYIMGADDKLYMDVKQYPNGQPMISKTATVEDADTEGYPVISFYPADTADMVAMRYCYDIRLWRDAEHIYTPVGKDEFIVLETVTKVV